MLFQLARCLLPATLLVACAVDPADESSDTQASSGENGLHGAPEPHLQADRASHHGGGGSSLLAYGGGSILATNTTQAIFWGSEWTSASFAGDKIAGLDTFFGGFGNSGLAGLSTEYYGPVNTYVTKQSTYLGHVIDTTAAPSKAITVNQAVAEACKITGQAPDPNGVYFLYTSTGAGHVSYCAWHSWGNCSNGAPIQVAYMPNIDGLAGCNPSDTYGTGHSEGLAALANVTSHELSEAITDPRGAGWTDSSGAEYGDKCAWTFTGPVTLSNGSTWKLQQEWSNNAYNASQGAPRGCLQQ